jgi:F-type H+-transporting ATPase subunit epsilon
MATSFSVTIIAPEATIWSGSATSLTATNSEGSFDILPDHTRFITLLQAQPIAIATPSGATETFTFGSSVLVFTGDEAKIFVHQQPTKN